MRLKILLLLVGLVSQLVGCAAMRAAFESPSVKLMCNSEFARSAGLKDGQQGDQNRTNLSKSQTCIESAYNSIMFEKDYMAGYEQGVASFCSDTGAKAYGRHQAEKFSEDSVAASVFEVCDSGRSRLAQVANAARRERLKEVCTVSGVATLARSDARKDEKIESVSGKFRACSENYKELEVAYQESFRDELSIVREEQRLEMEKERLRIERERLDIERQRLETERETGRLQSIERGRYSFIVDGVKLEAVCVIDEQRRSANIVVRMQVPEYKSVSFSGRWTVTFYDQNAKRLSSDWSHELIYIYHDGEDDFRSSRVPSGPVAYCQAVYTK
jgi:hypothetical protein